MMIFVFILAPCFELIVTRAFEFDAHPPKYCTAVGLKSVQYCSKAMTDYGRSAVSISSLANGALGEHRRQDTDGIKLEIAAPGLSVEPAHVDRA